MRLESQCYISMVGSWWGTAARLNLSCLQFFFFFNQLSTVQISESQFADHLAFVCCDLSLPEGSLFRLEVSLA